MFFCERGTAFQGAMMKVDFITAHVDILFIMGFEIFRFMTKDKGIGDCYFACGPIVPDL